MQRRHKCNKCNDIGIINLGKNQFPCICPTATDLKFNTSWANEQQSSKQVLAHLKTISNYPITLPDQNDLSCQKVQTTFGFNNNSRFFKNMRRYLNM